MRVVMKRVFFSEIAFFKNLTEGIYDITFFYKTAPVVL